MVLDTWARVDTFWACKHCKVFNTYTKSASEHIRNHLKKQHGLQEGTNPLPRAKTVLEMQKQAPGASHDPNLSDIDNQQIQFSKFQRALVAFICCCHIAFSIVQNDWFRLLLTTLSNLVPSFVPTSHTTAKDWVAASASFNWVRSN